MNILTINNKYKNLRNLNSEDLKNIIIKNKDNLVNFDKSINKPNFKIEELNEDILEALNEIFNNYKILNIRELAGRGYDSVLASKDKFVVIKGSRASKKSTVVALKIVYLMLKYPLANAVIFRATAVSNRESTFLSIQGALERFKLTEKVDFEINKSTMKITFLKTGQTIRFAGVENSGNSLTSLEVSQQGGFWNIGWLEEAYQVQNRYYSDFEKIIYSFNRAPLPEGYFPQFFITFNPYTPDTWLKSTFFNEDKSKRLNGTLALTTNWRCNEFLNEEYKESMLHLEKNNPRKARVLSFGDWGIEDGLVFENKFKVEDFPPLQLPILRGLDYGKTTDPTAYVALYLDIKNKKIYVFNEYYKTNKDTDELNEELIKAYNLKNKTVFSEIEHLINKSFSKKGVNIIQVSKKKNNLLYELGVLADFEIIISPKCENFIFEISNYALDSDGYPIDKNNHLMDALRYAFNAVLYPDLKKYVYDKNGERSKMKVSSVYKNLNKLL